MEFKDKVLTCRDCGAEFVFTAGEQEFYNEKGFQHEPVRCWDCRMARNVSAMMVRDRCIQLSVQLAEKHRSAFKRAKTGLYTAGVFEAQKSSWVHK